MPRMPPLDGVSAATVADAAPPPPPPPPPLRPPVALADMVTVGWGWVCCVGIVVGLGVVGKVTVLVDAMVSPGVGPL